MKLSKTFFKLPFRFDVERLRAETDQFTAADWSPHPQGFAGNDALILVSVDGGRNDEFAGPMQPTPLLTRCPYVQQVMGCFNTVIGRSRLMRLAGGAEVTAHYDLHYNWYHRVRIHVPIVTDPGVRFLCGDDEVHMQPGEAWIFDTWQFHNVINESQADRIHLVIDTAGSSAFWNLLERSWTLEQPAAARDAAELVPFQGDSAPPLRFERHNFHAIDPPSVFAHKLEEFRRELGRFAAEQPEPFAAVARVLAAAEQDWRCVWFEHGETGSGIAEYRGVVERTARASQPLLAAAVLDSNGAPAFTLLQNWLGSTINQALIGRVQRSAAPPSPTAATPPRPSVPRPTGLAGLGTSGVGASGVGASGVGTSGVGTSGLGASGLSLAQPQPGPAPGQVQLFQRPVFIVAAPRSGSTMLFETLRTNAAVWTIGDESHQAIESIPELNVASRGFASNALTAFDASPAVVQRLAAGFASQFRDADGHTVPRSLRFLEKTPKNALRIPFLRAAFPDALFIHLVREPRPNLGSMIDAWQSGRFVTYRDLPGWPGPPWSLLLIPGWQELAGRPLAEIVARQWAVANQTILDDLADLPERQRCLVRYEDLLSDRAGEVRRLCEFIGVPFGPRMQQLCAGDLPLSRYTLSQPAADKWRRHEAEIEPVMPDLAAVAELLEAAVPAG